MSVENLKAFGVKVVEDKELNRKAKETGLNNIDGMIALAKEYGYDICVQDFMDIAKDLESKDELSDDELEQVSGGTTVVAAAACVSAAAAVTSCTAQGGW
jgi:predicted ribosomally synthesized peptide with nif11-like leader